MDNALSKILFDFCYQYNLETTRVQPIIDKLNMEFYFKLKDMKHLSIEKWKGLNLPENLFYILEEKYNECLDSKNNNIEEEEENNKFSDLTKINECNFQIGVGLNKFKNIIKKVENLPINLEELEKSLNDLEDEINDIDKTNQIYKIFDDIIKKIQTNPNEDKYKKINIEKITNKFPFKGIEHCFSLLKFQRLPNSNFIKFNKDINMLSEPYSLITNKKNNIGNRNNINKNITNNPNPYNNYSKVTFIETTSSKLQNNNKNEEVKNEKAKVKSKFISERKEDNNGIPTYTVQIEETKEIINPNNKISENFNKEENVSDNTLTNQNNDLNKNNQSDNNNLNNNSSVKIISNNDKEGNQSNNIINQNNINSQFNSHTKFQNISTNISEQNQKNMNNQNESIINKISNQNNINDMDNNQSQNNINMNNNQIQNSQIINNQNYNNNNNLNQIHSQRYQYNENPNDINIAQSQLNIPNTVRLTQQERSSKLPSRIKRPLNQSEIISNQNNNINPNSILGRIQLINSPLKANNNYQNNNNNYNNNINYNNSDNYPENNYIEKTIPELLIDETSRRNNIILQTKINHNPKCFFLTTLKNLQKLLNKYSVQHIYRENNPHYLDYIRNAILTQTNNGNIKESNKLKNLIESPIITQGDCYFIFPDKYVIKGVFCLYEKVIEMYKFIRSFLSNPNENCIIYYNGNKIDLFYEEILSLNFTFPASFKVTFPIRYCGLSDDELNKFNVNLV